MHVQQAIAAIKANGLQENYEKLVRAKKECTEKLKGAVINCDLAEGEVRDNSALAKAVKTATEAQVKAKSVVEHITNQIFQLYSNFLLEEARQSWNKILAEQIHSSLWKDLRGIIHNSPRSKPSESFMECITFHMLTVFCNNAAKAQRYYISNCLKKPNRLPIRQFVQHIQQLNDYLELLPCLYQSNCLGQLFISMNGCTKHLIVTTFVSHNKLHDHEQSQDSTLSPKCMLAGSTIS